MPDDVIVNKAAIIERCVARVREVYAGNPTNLVGDFTKQDSIVLNIQRACETSIDMAMYVVRTRKLGIPQESRDAFVLLESAGLLDSVLASRLKLMVGFRNVAVHDYTALNLEVVQSIVTQHLDEFLEFSRVMVKAG